MAWWIKKQNLSEEQRQYIQSIKNNLNHVHWVRGAAGTGKTTVLAALTQELKLEYPNASFCYLTYTHFMNKLWEKVHIVFVVNKAFLDYTLIEKR